MPLVADFEEKEYEILVSIELAGGQLGRVWPAGQVLEGIVGYDAVADPAPQHLVWQVLGVPRPRGIQLVPPLWAPGFQPAVTNLPGRPASLILQYKRPELVLGANGKQWHFWHKPYLRFSRRDPQHSILRRLERNVGAHAVVRYISPAFISRSDLEIAASHGSILQQSGFVSPEALGTHRVWTFVAPGSDGFANPSGKRIRLQTVGDLSEYFRSQDAAAQGELVWVDQAQTDLRSHLSALSESLRYGQPRLRRDLLQFRRGLTAADLPLRAETLDAIVDLAAITTGLTALNASWHVMDGAIL